MTSSGEQQFLPLESLPADKWSISQGKSNGKPIFVRFNSSAKLYSGHPELTQRLGIAVPLREPNEHGLPKAAESQEFTAIEELLARAISAHGRMVLVITTGGMREFVSYVRSLDEGKKIIDEVRTGTTTHKIQFYVRPDAKWAAYGQFA